MWTVITNDGFIEAEFNSEDEAWEYVVRLDLNHIPGSETLNVLYVEWEDMLDANTEA